MNGYPVDCYDSRAPAMLKISYGPDPPSTITVWGNFIDYIIIGLSGKSFRALLHYWHSILENCVDTRYLWDGGYCYGNTIGASGIREELHSKLFPRTRGDER